jgi:hypothetical protein
MAKKPASALAHIAVAACAGVFRVDPMALQIVTSPVLIRALIQTIAVQIVSTVHDFSTLHMFASGVAVRKQEATKHA